MHPMKDETPITDYKQKLAQLKNRNSRLIEETDALLAHNQKILLALKKATKG